ncbi:MAG: MoaD/ThiS family protein [Bacilli bacterium]|nr:MoaD/ThiS family protein [Bacilli bacterium]
MIKVYFYGVTREKVNMTSMTTNVKSLSILKGMIPGLSRKEVKDLVVLVNGKKVKKNYHFKDGDIVYMLSPAGGG